MALSQDSKAQADVDEFIRRLKANMEVTELRREMCMELIEFVTVDKCPGRYSKEPREIHIYYKLIDKPLTQRRSISRINCVRKFYIHYAQHLFPYHGYMRQQAAVKIDREISGCDTQMPIEDGMRTDANTTAEIATEEEFEPYRGKIRKPGTGRISKINDHLYEGRFTPTLTASVCPRISTPRLVRNARKSSRAD